MNLRKLFLVASVLCASSFIQAAHAQAEAPDALVKRVSSDVLDAVRADPTIQPGNVGKVVELVDAKILPSFDFERMTASAVGPRWKDASAEQKASLQEQFKILLVRAYSGALAQARDRTVEIQPLRGAPAAEPQAVVKTIIRGGREPVGLDFRLVNEGAAWKITDVNIGGLWLVENYRGNFAQEISNGGIDGLIGKLGERNKALRN